MNNSIAEDANQDTMVAIGELEVAKPPCILKTQGIGSCIAVVLYDGVNRIGGLAHVLLPSIEEGSGRSQPARFADIAVEMLIDEMKEHGAQLQNVTAKIFGGANVFPQIIASDSPMDVGKRNISAVKEELRRHDVRIVASEVGDRIGRSVTLDTSDGSVVVTTSSPEGERVSIEY